MTTLSGGKKHYGKKHSAKKHSAKKHAAKKSVGSRAQVYHGTAKQTSGGLKKKDLVKRKGRIVSKKAREAALKRFKKMSITFCYF